jgi:excinuclease ABC subunit A
VLAEATIDCPECGGLRYRRDVLEATWRGLSIAEVLRLTVREAFPVFRNHRRAQKVLKTLIDVGLEYLPLGQPGPSLSGGERQRLHLAERLLSKSKARALFLLDEPTVGLHAADVSRLTGVVSSLLDAGHTVIVVGHDRQLLANADHVIDLGPGSGTDGGRVVYAGPPEGLAGCRESATGRWLASVGEGRGGSV